ncbi:hypothetical protein GCM10027299_21630 [Larkinella ripae]
MDTLKIYEYRGSSIEFQVIDNELFANATGMCQAFGKRPNDWLSLPATQRYIDGITRKSGNAQNEIVRTIRGGLAPGTWIHEKLILKLAQWLDVDFEIQCDEWVGQLLKTGKIEVAPKEISRKDLAMMVLKAEEEKEQLLLEKMALQEKVESDKSKVDFYDAVTESEDVVQMGDVAKVLNFAGIGRNNLFEILRQEKVLMNGNAPYQKYVEQGWFKIVESKWTDSYGASHISLKTVVYQKGVDGIRNLLIRRQARNRPLPPGQTIPANL